MEWIKGFQEDYQVQNTNGKQPRSGMERYINFNNWQIPFAVLSDDVKIHGM